MNRCLQHVSKAQHLNFSPPGTILVHTCGCDVTLNTVVIRRDGGLENTGHCLLNAGGQHDVQLDAVLQTQ